MFGGFEPGRKRHRREGERDAAASPGDEDSEAAVASREGDVVVDGGVVRCSTVKEETSPMSTPSSSTTTRFVAEFRPWQPPPLLEQLARVEFLQPGPDSTRARLQDLTAPTLAFFVGASWCRPCMLMKDMMLKMREAEENPAPLDVVLLSEDDTEAGFELFRSNSPWLAMPFDEMALKEGIVQRFNIQKIPSLVLVDRGSGEVLKVVNLVAEIMQGKMPWKRS